MSAVPSAAHCVSILGTRLTLVRALLPEGHFYSPLRSSASQHEQREGGCCNAL